MVASSRNDALNLDFVSFLTFHRDVFAILSESMLPVELESLSLSFTAKDVTTELFRPQLASFGTETFTLITPQTV